MADKIKNIITPVLTVKWSNLIKPDDMSGAHDVTVILTPELEALMQDAAKAAGIKKINGIKEKDGVRTAKFKSKLYVSKGNFPCQDSTGGYTSVVPFGGDEVRLRVGPAVVSVGAASNKSMSFFLNGVQIIGKNSTTSTRVNGFEPVADGFVGERVDAPVRDSATATTAPAVPAVTDDEVPF